MEYSNYDRDFINMSKTILTENDLKIINSDFYFDLINDKYPFMGNRIDFKKLNNNKYYKLDDTNVLNEASKIILNIINENNLNTEERIVYIGDSLTEQAYEFKLKNLVILLPFILDIPQHHYFIPQNFAWCLTISFENDLEFGVLGGRGVPCK